MASSLADMATLVGGVVVGDGSLEVFGAATLSDADFGDVTFVDHADKMARLDHCGASAAIVPCGVVSPRIPVIQVDDVLGAFARVVVHFRPPRVESRVGVSPQAMISPTARLGANVDVHPGAFIGDEVEVGEGSTIHSGVRILAGCRIGKQVTIFPNVVLYENTLIGPRAVIHAGAILGAHGFGYKLVAGKHQLSAQLGYVEIGADVEIGAGTTIDRGTYGATLVGDGTKIDDQVMIAHNCRLGRHNLICSQVGIAGSTTTGDYVVMAGQVGVADHVHIGNGAMLGAKAGVHGDVGDGVSMLGCPATPLREQRLMMGVYAKLPEMRRQLKALQAAVDLLTKSAESDERDRQAA